MINHPRADAQLNRQENRQNKSPNNNRGDFAINDKAKRPHTMADDFNREGRPVNTTKLSPSSTPPLPERLAYSIPESAKAANSSRSSIYLAIARGELIARKHGKRTIILPDELRRYLQGLPQIGVG